MSKPLVMITGAAGGLASIVIDMLATQYDLIGVDPREMPASRTFPGQFYRINYRHRKMAEIFRQNRFHALLHLGRIPVTSSARRSVRFSLNLLGTKNLFDLCVKYNVPNVVVFSTFHVYGAHRDNYIHITEDEPLRAAQIFPDLADAVELDNLSTIFLLRSNGIRTLVLRPVNVIGPRIRNQISRLLRADYCPMLFGYDPILQFIHERDIANALSLCLTSERSGVYNIAGEGVIPYSQAIKLAGAIPVPVPTLLAYPLFAAFSQLGSRFPKHLIDFYRYPTIVSDASFRKDFGFVPAISTVEALKSIRPHTPILLLK